MDQLHRDQIITALNLHRGNGETRVSLRDIVVDLRDLGCVGVSKDAHSDGSLKKFLESYGCQFDSSGFVLTGTDECGNSAVQRQIQLMLNTPGSKPTTPPATPWSNRGHHGNGFRRGNFLNGTGYHRQDRHPSGIVRGAGQSRGSGNVGRPNCYDNNRNNQHLPPNGFSAPSSNASSWKAPHPRFTHIRGGHQPHLARGRGGAQNFNNPRDDGQGFRGQRDADVSCKNRNDENGKIFCYHQRGNAFGCFHRPGSFNTPPSPAPAPQGSGTGKARLPYGAPAPFVGYGGILNSLSRREDPDSRSRHYGTRGLTFYRSRGRGRGRGNFGGGK
uniref:HTH OST-type domain-containing protein n=1 Tax=Panagrellus redivivus TaxID=6233 RepID=A0A7E4VM74_PANRE